MMKKITLFLLSVILLGSSAATARQTGYAHSEGVDIYYRIFGSGDPLLVINGGPGFSSEGFTGLAEKLGEEYRVILYDQRGTGKSQMEAVDNSNMTMDLMVKDLEALRKHLNLSEWTILGHSFGGVLANYYAAKHPDRVSGLIASSSGGVDLGLLDYFDINQQLTPAESDSLAYWTTRINEGDTTAYADQKRREFFAAAYVYHDQHIPEIAERMTQSNSTINGLIWSDLQRIEYDVSEELSGFAKPVLIIQGRQDIIRESTAQKAMEVFSNAELVLLDRCGHYGWLDRPEQYFEEIFSFMGKNELYRMYNNSEDIHIEFRPLAKADIPLLFEWLRQPHLLEWWRGEQSPAEVREKYLPRIAGKDDAKPFLALINDKPEGYIQYYRAAAGDPDWWPDEPDPEVLGIDLFLADEHKLNRGIGTAVVSQFVTFLFQNPEVTEIRVDPRPDNLRAIRCYEKAGFQKIGPITNPDGPALMMVLKRHH